MSYETKELAEIHARIRRTDVGQHRAEVGDEGGRVRCAQCGRRTGGLIVGNTVGAELFDWRVSSVAVGD